MSEPLKVEAKPILKWAGGKRELAKPILKHMLSVYPKGFDDYYEPFCGGAAIFFALRARGLIHGQAFLSDTNAELIHLYQCVRDDVEAVIRALKKWCELATPSSGSPDRDRYYLIRDASPKSDFARAARTIYLNKNGFNGLYRVNKSGGFNVPWNKRKTPYVPEVDEIRSASRALQHVHLTVREFDADWPDWITERDGSAFVYLDPPYMPKHKKGMTPSFTAYGSNGFGRVEHERLAELAVILDQRRVPFLLSNADTPASRALYQKLTVKKVMVSRSINSVGTGRGKVSEILVSNRTKQ